MEGHWKFLGGWGVLKAKFLEEMYGNKLDLPGGRGGFKQKPSVGGVWVFSETAQLGNFQLSLLTLSNLHYSDHKTGQRNPNTDM